MRCVCCIDIHAHMVPAQFPARLAAAGLSTAAAPDVNGACHRQVLVHGKHYRTVSDKCWSAARRIGDFDDMGLSHQVVPPMPELLSYWLALPVAQPLIRYLNEQTAQLCAESADRLLGPAPLQQVLAYPTDVGLAAASVITGGLLQRLPGLRMAFSHGGGTLMALLPRLQQGWTSFPALASSIAESPREQARRLFYDTLVFGAPTLRLLHASVGTQALLIGTDHPFNFLEPRPMERLAEAGLDATTQEALAGGNARRFLGARAGAALGGLGLSPLESA